MPENWTNGPWEHYGSMIYANRPEDGGTICQVSEVRHSHIVSHKEPEFGSPDRNEIYANARLISAAPELYEALKEVVAISDRKHDAWEKARAALAKARGEP